MSQVAGQRARNKSGSVTPFVILASVCVIVWIVARTFARPQQALPVKNVLQSNTFADLMPVVFSPDGKWLAYVTKSLRDETKLGNYHSTSVPVGAQGATINLLNVVDRRTRDLTAKSGDSWGPKWAPNGRFLAFLSDRGNAGQAKLWIWDAARDGLKRASSATVKGSEIQWFPDSQRVLVASLSGEPPASRAPDQSESQGKNGEEPIASTAIVYYGGNREGSEPARQTNPWDLDWAICDLAIVDIETGHVSNIVRRRRVGTFLLSPDAMWVAYTSPARFEQPGSQQVLFDIGVVNPVTNEDRVLASGVRLGYSGAELSWSPDSGRLAYRQYGPRAKANDVYVIDVNTGHAERKTDFSTHSGGPLSGLPLWDAQGRFLYSITAGALWEVSAERGTPIKLASIPDHPIVSMIAQSANILWTPQGGRSTIVIAHDAVEKQDGFYRVDLMTGKTTKLLERAECYLCNNLNEGQFVSTAPDRRLIAYFAEDAQHPADLWVSDPDFRKAEQLTHLNPQLDQYEMGRAELLNWIGDDGQSLHGALVLPPGYQKGRHYPLIVWVYGGVTLSDRLSEFGLVGPGPFNVQLLATRGYAVLCPDAPQHLGTPMLDLAKTVLPGVNKLIEMGIADPQRIGLIGHSYGGYSVLALIVQTKRFGAALELDGMGDFISAYGQMDQSGSAFQTTVAEEGQGLLGGTLWEYRNRYIENSPIFYLDRVETPLLIIHGSSDTAVAPYLGDEIFVALRRLEREVQYVKYIGEGHVPTEWRYVNQEDLCERMISWFDKHLGESQPQ